MYADCAMLNATLFFHLIKEVFIFSVFFALTGDAVPYVCLSRANCIKISLTRGKQQIYSWQIYVQK